MGLSDNWVLNIFEDKDGNFGSASRRQECRRLEVLIDKSCYDILMAQGLAHNIGQHDDH